MSHIDLHTVSHALEDCLKEADELHSVEYDRDAPGGSRRPEIAVNTRRLLALADKLDLLAALTRQEYWAIKGNERITL